MRKARPRRFLRLTQKIYSFGGVNLKKCKRLLSTLLAALMLLGCIQAAFIAGAKSANAIKVATISDIRYQAGAADKDGLLLSRSAALLDAAIEQVKASDADVLLVTGDLTNNGSRPSHDYVAGRLADVKAEGIPVYVIPGEHDVREGGTTTAVSKAVFKDIYRDFGYGGAQQDSGSASYIADLGNGFKVAMSDSVAADGQGQLPQWVVDQAKTEIAKGSTVFAASHHPAATRGSVDRTFIDLLHTLAGLEIDLGGKVKLYTHDPDQAAASLGLVDRARIMPEKGANPAALADAGVKFLFTGHAGQLSISGFTTNNGAQMYDVMSGSLVNASSSVRFATLSKASAGMKEQRAEFATSMIASAAGVENVEQAAHAALKKQMPAEVDYAIEVAEKVIAHLVPAIKPNVQTLVRNLDLGALGVDIPNIADGVVQDIKNDLADQYIAPLLDLLSNRTKLHNVIVDVRNALEAMDFNGQSFYAFLTDVFITIQKGDGKTPASVEGFFNALRNQEPELLVGVIQSFADNFASANLVNLANEILDLRFADTYIGTVKFQLQLRGLLAGSYPIVSGLIKVNIDLWSILDDAISLPNGKTISAIARPIVNDLILGGPNDASTKQTPARFTQNLKNNAAGVVNLLFDFGVGDLIGTDIFAQGQSGVYVARTVTLDELGAILDRLVPNNDVTSLNAADWAAVRDALNAAGRFTADQLATVNKVLVAATDSSPAVTQLDKLKELANAAFYQAVAEAFTAKVNALPAADDLTLDDAAQVRALQSEYDQFYTEIRANLSSATVDKLNAACARILALENFDPAVDAVVTKIAAIGVVTPESEAAIQGARTAYDALTIRQRKQVTNYQVLVDAEAALIIVKENAALIKSVEDKISAIGEVEYTAASKAKIDLARTAYENLAGALQAMVGNYDVLTAAEARYAELKTAAEDAAAAAPIIAQISAIGTVTLESKRLIEAAEAAYAALTDTQKALVTNYDVLTAARTAYDALVQADADDEAAAQVVMGKIAAIGTVTLDSEAAIQEARAAYDALTAAQKNRVTNLSVLTNAEAALAALQKQAADEAAADAVDALIDAIGDVTLEKEDQIIAARDAYNALTSDQKRLVTKLSALTEAEAQLSVLKNDFLFEDAKTGITLRADSGVLPLDTVMTVRPIVSGDVYDAILAKGYQAIHLYDISLLAGGSAVTPSKAVKITIPQFAAGNAVYSVAADGTMTLVEAALENGSFNFSTDAIGMFVVAQSKATVDTTALQAAIAAFEALNANHFNAAAFAKAKAACDTAKAELDANYELTAANQRRVDAAAAALNDALAALTPLPANFTQLRKALLGARKLVPADYKNFSAVTVAIDEAQAILNNSASYDIRNQAEIDKAAAKLTNAVNALVWAAPDFSPIDQAIAAIPANSQSFTADSWAAVVAARDAALTAKTTITRADANWQAQVEQYAKAVRDAVNALVLKNTTPADISKLQRAIKLAALYSPQDYSNYDAVTAAVAAGENLITSRPTSDQQASVDVAAEAILNAIANLQWAQRSLLYRAVSAAVRLVRMPSLFF